jgi:hypothetical protein
MSALDEVFDKHMSAAKQLLEGEDLARFLARLHADVSNLRTMLRAIYIGTFSYLCRGKNRKLRVSCNFIC